MLLDDETRKNVEISISYARSADAFRYLRCDPGTLKPSEIPHSPIILGVPEELRHLIRVVFRSIYALEDREAQKKRAASQHLCDLLFDLWLHFDTYNAGESTDVLSCLHILGDAVTEAIFVAGKDRRWEAEGGTQSKPGGNRWQVFPPYISPVCAPAALSAIRYHPRRLYRKALVQVRLALAEAPESVPTAASIQILVLTRFAMEVLPLLKPAQDIICDLVSILRTIANRNDGAYWTTGVALVLAAFWESARDEKPIVWALQAGFLPLALGMPETGQKAAILGAILKSAYHVRVLRALSSDGPITAISPSRLGENPFMSADAWLECRVKLLNDAYRDVCDNVQCPSRTLHGPVHIRRCPCFNASYCSEDCQRAHWALHKEDCGKGAEGTGHLGFTQGNLKPLDAHFVAIWTRWYALTHSPTICHSLRRVRSRLPRSRISRIYVVTVFLSRLPTQFTVAYNTNAPSCPEDTVVVMACMAGPGRSGPIDLRVVSSSVTFLEEYAASLVKGGYRVADWQPIIEKTD
ncbi:hypothetical protein EV121DRAFT_191347 [Schizophyllum commune]